MASLYKRGRTYYASFSDPERGRKRVSLRTGEKPAARALLARFERLVALGEADPWTDDLHALVRPDPEEHLLEEAFEEFLASKRAENCKENTLRTYRETVGHLIREVGGAKPLRTLTPARLRHYVHGDSSLAPATRRKRYRQVPGVS